MIISTFLQLCGSERITLEVSIFGGPCMHMPVLDTVGNFLRGWPRTALLGYFLHAEWVRIGLGCWPLAGFLAFIRGRPIDDVTPNDVDHNNDKSFEAIDSTRDMSDGESIDLYLLSLSPKSCPTACDLDPLQCHTWTVSVIRLEQYQ